MSAKILTFCSSSEIQPESGSGRTSLRRSRPHRGNACNSSARGGSVPRFNAGVRLPPRRSRRTVQFPSRWQAGTSGCVTKTFWTSMCELRNANAFRYCAPRQQRATAATGESRGGAADRSGPAPRTRATWHSPDRYERQEAESAPSQGRQATSGDPRFLSFTAADGDGQHSAERRLRKYRCAGRSK